MKFIRALRVVVGSLLLFSGISIADTLPLPNIAGFPSPSFVNDMVLIDDPGNNNDSTGYGGVDHKYKVSATHITVQDWVEFLNDIEDRLGLDASTWGFGPMNGANGYTSDCTNGWCYQPYAKSGSNWIVTTFNQNGASLSSGEAANLPIDWISMNMAARYLNWLATGHPNTGAFTFSFTGGEPQGNWDISSFDATYPGPRLPLEDELYKAMYRSNSGNTYYDYPLGSNSLTQATTDPTTALHNSGNGGALLWDGGTSIYGQVGQETGNPWSVRDVGGNRHETTLNPNNTLETIIRGSSAFQGSNVSLSTTRLTQDDHNGNGPFLARKRFLSVSYRVWSGVSAPSGLIRITKNVTGGTDNQNFTFSLDCAGTLYDVSNIQIGDGDTWESDSIPAGTSCTVNETSPTAPGGFTYGAAQYSPSQTVTVQDGNTITVTTTNPLQQASGSLSISKNVTGEPAGFSSPGFSIVVDCSDNSFDQTVTVQDGQTQTINNIPAGTTCSLTEPTLPSPPSGYAYGTPTISPSSVTIQAGSAVSVTVTNPLQQTVGSLQITKNVTGQPSGFSSPDFDILVDCSDDTFDQTVTLQAGGSQTINNIPAGTTCTITEPTQPGAPTNYNYDTPVISPSGVTIQDTQTVSVSVTNPLVQGQGNLEISKVVTGQPSGFSSPDFDILVDCSDDTFDQTVTLQAGGSQTINNIPAGTTCTITEPTQPGAPTNYNYDTPVISPSGVTIQDTQTVSVSVTNPLVQGQGNLEISKVVTGQPSGFSSPDFDILVDCSDDTFDQTVTLQAGGSQTINNIPAGTTCTITEPTQPGAPTNYNYDTPVISPSGVTIQDTQTVSVSVTNPLVQGQGNLEISKVVTGQPSGFSSPDFDILVDCSDDTFDQTVTLQAGGSQTINNIPSGTTCTITEPTQPGAPTNYNYDTPVISPSGVTIQDTQTVSVSVTNPLVQGQGNLEISKVVTGQPSGFSSPDFDILVDCSDDTFDQTVTLQAGGSQTINNIPAGTTCTITEPTQPGAPTGYNYDTPVISPSGVTIQDTQTVSVSVTNPLLQRQGSLEISKVVTGQPSGFSSPDFDILVDCSDDAFDQTVNIADGATQTINGIPENTTCTVTEPSQPAAPAGYSYGAPAFVPASAATAPGVTITVNTTVSVAVTNPLTPDAVCSITPTVTTNCSNNSTPADPGDDIFSYTINTTGSDIGASYSVSGDDTQAGLSYNAGHTFGAYPINGGNNLNLTVTDIADGNCINNAVATVPATCSNASQIDLDLTKVVSPDEAAQGDTVTYTLTLRNDGPDDAADVEVTDQLPGGITYVSDNASQGNYNSGTGIWVVGALANGATATLTIEVTVD
uniref:Uncharacterized protein n=2 Tax=uncultured Thiotrichaceae bacterium TaxID=298394 RepID=A0A6S6SA33_9GAMM|nr:MAG: Unknown protein [uncultured Thiotrichaceae bacterium]CAA6799806.1 MAG: Unknown protein [uncultured Thiotrichaceae bacterium]